MIYEKMLYVQEKMKAPKDLWNSFGNYKYRNAESILEAFKPFGKELGLVLFLSDSVEEIGGKTYIKATATLVDVEDHTTANQIVVSAYAREPDSKKGMDTSQVTGATSSYARKYCLNGLFLLDDTKDPDTDEYKMESDNRQKRDIKRPSESQIKALNNLIIKKGRTVEEMLKWVKAPSMQELTADSYNAIVKRLQEP